MPKQNRPLVRGGRLQAKKKRTDRSYLRPTSPASAPAPDESDVVETPADEPVNGASSAVVDQTAEIEPEAVASSPVPEAVRPMPSNRVSAQPAAATVRATPTRVPTNVRAIQQQGVRKRREFDVHALAVRDTRYAMHELRRIAILATLVIITLIVLGIVMR